MRCFWNANEGRRIQEIDESVSCELWRLSLHGHVGWVGVCAGYFSALNLYRGATKFLNRAFATLYRAFFTTKSRKLQFIVILVLWYALAMRPGAAKVFLHSRLMLFATIGVPFFRLYVRFEFFEFFEFFEGVELCCLQITIFLCLARFSSVTSASCLLHQVQP